MTDNDERRADPRVRYSQLVAESPDHFADPDPHGVVILSSEAERRAAEAEIETRFAAAGQPRAWAHAGVFYEDGWLYFVRDVVRFPDGNVGTHHRIIHKTGPDSVGILPRCQGKLILLRHFRHGMRNWTLEFPRGGGELGVPPEATARAEVHEELGGEIVSIRRLGLIYPQNNIMMTRIQLYFAELSHFGAANEAEGIAEIKPVSVEELEHLIDCDVVSDATSVALYARARLRGLL